MHLHIIDHYQKMKSPIHSLDGRAKLVFIVAIILSCTLLPTSAWPAYILLFSILVALILLSDLNLAYVMKRSLLVLPFLLTAFPLIFRASESSIITYTVDKITITISQEGLIRFVSLGIKSWLSVIAAILLASTTSFT
ncbi:MAG: energy-coupling factor transporter transmembrane component T, partial [Anaerolineaceae bacterium]